jgi:hypothetical protein
MDALKVATSLKVILAIITTYLPERVRQKLKLSF